jgi:hypothetical protein
MRVRARAPAAPASSRRPPADLADQARHVLARDVHHAPFCQVLGQVLGAGHQVHDARLIGGQLGGLTGGCQGAGWGWGGWGMRVGRDKG